MKAAGNVVAGGVVVGGLSLPTEPRPIDRDAIRERREAEKARQAARNPFSRLGPAPSVADARRAALVDHTYEGVAFTTPERIERDADEVDATTADEPATALAAPQTPQGAAPSDTNSTGPHSPGVVEVEGDGGTSAVHPRPAGPRDDVEPTPEEAAVTAPTPAAPKPGPTGRPLTPPGPTAGPRKPIDAAGIVREYVEDRMTIPEIARRRGHSPATVRRLLKATPGVVMRDDRATHSGGQNVAAEHDDPQVVETVRRLYVDEGMTQAQVAQEARLTLKVVQRIMRDHDIPARPAAHVSKSATTNGTGRKKTPPELVRQIRTLYEGPERLTQRDIGHRLGIPQTTVSRLMRRNGIGTATRTAPSPKPGTPAPSTPDTATPTAAAALATIQDAALAAVAEAHEPVGEFLGALESALLAVDELRDAVLDDMTQRLRALADHARADIALLRGGAR